MHFRQRKSVGYNMFTTIAKSEHELIIIFAIGSGRETTQFQRCVFR